jgi:hypothetical protein
LILDPPQPLSVAPPQPLSVAPPQPFNIIHPHDLRRSKRIDPPQPLRRSKRIASKPLVQYATDQDFIVDIIEAYCNKKKYNYDEVIVEDFNHWVSTNRVKWSDPTDIRNIVIDWLQYYSRYIKRERLFKKLHTSLIKYCHANDIVYHKYMDIVLLTWIDDQKAKGTIDGEYPPSYYIKKWFPDQKYFPLTTNH